MVYKYKARNVGILFYYATKSAWNEQCLFSAFKHYVSSLQTVGTVRVELQGDLDSGKFDLFLQTLLWENEVQNKNGAGMQVLRMKV